MRHCALLTIASRNYLPWVRTLMASAEEHCPDCDLFFCLADDISTYQAAPSDGFEVIDCRHIGIPCFSSFAFRYQVIEFNTAVKPFALSWLIGKGYRKVIYLDPDILLYSSISPVTRALESNSIVLTPHMLSPLPRDGKQPDEAHIMHTGVYNLGFIGVANDVNTRAFLEWWSEKCLGACYDEPGNGLFVDQRYVDLVPALFNGVHILRHKGCNVAYWNLHERTSADGRIDCGGSLVFFHFSGYRPDAASEMSKYQDRHFLGGSSEVDSLFDEYRRRLVCNGFGAGGSGDYSFGRYKNGEQIGVVARRLYSHTASKFPQPFEVGPGSYYEFLRKRGLLEKAPSTARMPQQLRGRSEGGVQLACRAALRVLGPDRYKWLMNYLRHMSTIRNQQFLVEE